MGVSSGETVDVSSRDQLARIIKGATERGKRRMRLSPDAFHRYAPRVCRACVDHGFHCRVWMLYSGTNWKQNDSKRLGNFRDQPYFFVFL